MFKKFDNYDGVCFFNGLIFYAPVALLSGRRQVFQMQHFSCFRRYCLSLFLSERFPLVL